MHELYKQIRGNGRTKYTEEIIREDSDVISFKGFRNYLERGVKKATKLLVNKLVGNSEPLENRLEGCSVIFETLENDHYILEVTVHERSHGEEFIVQGNLYQKTNAHFDTDNIIEAPRRTFVGNKSRTSAFVYANDFIREISAKYNLE